MGIVILLVGLLLRFAAFNQALAKINPVVVLPPVIYWNSSNFISVSWPATNSEVVAGFVSLYKDGRSFLASNVLPFRPGMPVVFQLGPAGMVSSDNYEVEVRELSSGFAKSYPLGGAPNLHTVFIQTDKPLYKAAQIVKVRILPLTLNGSISPVTLEVQLENPEMFILMSRQLKADDTFIKTEFELPQHLSLGIWRIVARPLIGGKSFQDFEKKIEVQDYDLPHFQVKMFAESEEELFETGITDIIVAARYSFGKPAFGEVKIYCGRIQVSRQILLIKPIITGDMEDGIFRGKFNITSCHRRRWRKMGVNLTATVRDHGTGDLESDFLELLPTRRDFYIEPLKPGFGEKLHSFLPFLIKSNSAAQSNKKISLQAVCIGNGTKIEELMKFDARIGDFLTLNVSGVQCSAVLINASDSVTSKAIIIPRLKKFSPLIRIDSNRRNKAVYTVGEILEIGVEQNLVSNNQNADTSFLVVCNGELVGYGQSGNNGQIRIIVTEKMWPSCSMIVYRPSSDSGDSPLVDIIKFSVISSCHNNVNISTPSYSSAPGSSRHLVLRGPAYGIVGIKAFDERISYLLEKEERKNDMNKDVKHWVFLLNRTLEERNFVKFFNLFDTTEITGMIMKFCQDAGKLWWNLYDKCPSLQMTTSAVSDLCHQQFLSHCGVLEGAPPSLTICERGKISKNCQPRPLSGSGFKMLRVLEDPTVPTKVEIREKEILGSSAPASDSVRKFFPETWLFYDYKLNGSGATEIPAEVPHSITNWTVSGHFWGAGWKKTCEASPVTVTSFQKFFMRVEIPEEVYLGEFLFVKVTVFMFDVAWREDHNRRSEHKVGVCYKHENDGICTDMGTTGSKYTGAHVLTIVAKHKQAASKTLPFEFLRIGEYPVEFSLRDFTNSRSCETAPILDTVKHVVTVQKRESVVDYYRSFIMDPTKPKTSVTTNELNDENLRYIEFLEEETEATRNRLRAQLDVTVPEGTKVLKFTVEFSRFLSHIRPTTEFNFDVVESKAEVANRRKKRRATAFLSELLKKASVILYKIKSGNTSSKEEPFSDQLETILADVFTFSDCSFNKSQCGYSQVRWPSKVANRSQWLTVLATSISCEAGVNATVVCPSLRWILLLEQNGELKSDFRDTKLASTADEDMLLKAMVFQMLYECSSYRDECVRDNSDPFPLGEVSVSLYEGFYIDEQETDPITVAALAFAVSYANSPLMYPFQHHLYSLIARENKAPYWNYGNDENIIEKFTNKLQAWFGSSKSRLRKANDILLNSLAFLAFLNEQSEPGVKLNLDPLADWIYSQQKTEDGGFYYTLDSYFAARAIYLYKLKKSGLLGSQNLTVTLECAECSPVERRLNDEISVIHIPVSTTRVKVAATGVDKVKFGVRLVLSTPSRVKRQVDGDSNEEEKLPMDIKAVTVIAGPGPVFNQTVCLKTAHPILTDMVSVEHGIFTGYKLDKRSFTISPGSSCAFHGLDVSAHLVQFLLTNLTAAVNHCYTMTLYPPSVTHSSTLAPVPVMTKHPEHGLTGLVYLQMGSLQEVTRSQIEKLCYGDGHCACTEGSCHSKKCLMCGQDGEVARLTDFICQKETFGAVVKAVEVELIGFDYVRMKASIRHDLSLGNKYVAECTECEIYQRVCIAQETLLCQFPVKDTLYFIAGISKKWHVDANSTLPVYFLGENDYFEKFLSCPGEWQTQVLRLSSEEMRHSICSEVSKKR